MEKFLFCLLSTGAASLVLFAAEKESYPISFQQSGEAARKTYLSLQVKEEIDKTSTTAKMKTYKVGKNVLCTKTADVSKSEMSQFEYFCSMGLNTLGESQSAE